MSPFKPKDTPSMPNPNDGDETNGNGTVQSQGQGSAVPQSPDSNSALHTPPAHRQQGQHTASLPAQPKGKSKRHASNSPHADSTSPGLRRKRTKPNLKISPAVANSPFSSSSSKPGTAGTPLKTSDNAPPSEKTSFGLGIGGFSTDTAAGPARGDLTALASSFGQMFSNVNEGNGNTADEKSSRDRETANVKTKEGHEEKGVKGNGKNSEEKSDTDEEPYDTIMASLEAANLDESPEDLDIGSLTPPGSPVISAQRQRAVGKGKGKQPRMVFSIGEAIMSQNDILLNVCNFMGLRDFFNLYSVSKKFYVLVNSHYNTHMLQLARNHAPVASPIFPYQLYKRACIRDPMYRTRPAHRSDHPSTYINPVLNPSTRALGATVSPVTPANTNRAPEVVRTVPGLRWVFMCAYREAIVHDILLCMALEGHRFPGAVPTALLKMWALLDHPFNGTRLAVVRDEKLWTDHDIFLALMFCIKLDMRFSDPVLGSGECLLRRLFMGQRSFVVLWEALRGLTARSRAEVLHMLVRWDCAASPETLDSLANSEDGGSDTCFGVPVDQVGSLSREGWRQGAPPLLRPDQLLLREGTRRGLNIHRCLLDYMLWGYIDWIWLIDIDEPDIEGLEEIDRERRAGNSTAGPTGENGERQVSSGSLREMMKASRVSDN